MKLRSAVSAAMLCSVVVTFSVAARNRRIDEFKDATQEEREMKSVAAAPGASAIILDWVQRHDDVDMEASEYVRIKILTDEGKKYGDIEIPYIPQINDISHITARTTKPDGTVVNFLGKPFEKLIVKAGGIRLMAKTFSIPDLAPGSIIEYRYDIGFRGNVLRDTRFTVQRELPVKHEMLWLRPYREQYKAFFTYKGLPDGKKPVDLGDHYELELENLPAFVAEAFMPPEGMIKPQVNFFYTDGTLDAEAFWKKTGKEWTGAIEDFIGDRAYPKQVALEVTAGATTSEAKLRKIYERAQAIRNLSFEDEKTLAEEKKFKDNKSAEDVLRNGYGYSPEITRAFIAMARGAGFEANAVRISERDDHFLAKNLPISSQLDGEIALVKLDGKDVYVDPGTPTAPFAIAAWKKTGAGGLRLARKKDAEWVQTPDPLSNDAVWQRKADLRIEGESVKGTVTLTYKGQEALVRRVTNYTDDEAATKKSVEESAKKLFPEGTTVKLLSMTGMKAWDEPVVVKLDVDMPGLASFAGSRVLVPMSVFASSRKNPFAAESRKYGVYFSYPFIEEDDVTLQLPEGYSVESTPNAASVDLNAIQYSSRYAAGTGRTLHYTRSLMIHNAFFSLENYATLRSFYGKVTAADQEQAIVRASAKPVAK
jgi:hypothetical protein